ncbi:MAG TPA: methyltransferase domain-containing protein [Rhizomicrobium sp.]|nr:methyltransferase domain-containing protein [Rhizomicrobium sp.]
MSSERPHLFDFRAAGAARLRAARIGGDRFLDVAGLDGIVHRLQSVTRRFGRGLWVGGNVPNGIRAFAQEWAGADFDDQEFLKAEGPFDLAVSLFSLQAINDLPGAMIQIHRLLKPDGLFLAVLFGGATLNELRQSFVAAESEIWGGASPRVAPFADVRDMGALLQRAGFALPVADVERLVVRYSSLSGLVRDLRAHGQSNTLAKRRKNFIGRRTLESLNAHYAANHAQDGKLVATFEMLFLTGWSPHESQQQPLQPGSAKARLSDALGTVERKA